MSCERERLVAPFEMKAIKIPMRAQLSLRRSLTSLWSPNLSRRGMSRISSLGESPVIGEEHRLDDTVKQSSVSP
jgi:hypothetical protein